MCRDVRIRRLFTGRVRRAVVYRWIVGAVAGLVGVPGCRFWVGVVRWIRWRGRLSNGVAVCVGQAAIDGELQQLLITQVIVERIILPGQTRTGRSSVRDPGCCHDGTGGTTMVMSLKQRRRCTTIKTHTLQMELLGTNCTNNK